MNTATRAAIAAELTEAARAATENAKGARQALAAAAITRHHSALYSYVGNIAFHNTQAQYLTQVAAQLVDETIDVASLIRPEPALRHGDHVNYGQIAATRYANTRLHRIISAQPLAATA